MESSRDPLKYDDTSEKKEPTEKASNKFVVKKVGSPRFSRMKSPHSPKSGSPKIVKKSTYSPKSRYDSQESRELHTLLFNYWNDRAKLSDVKKQMKRLYERNPKLLLLTSKHKHTVLMDALHLPFGNKANVYCSGTEEAVKKADDVMTVLAELFIEKLSTNVKALSTEEVTMHSENAKKIFLGADTYNFNPLTQLTKNGNVKLLRSYLKHLQNMITAKIMTQQDLEKLFTTKIANSKNTPFHLVSEKDNKLELFKILIEFLKKNHSKPVEFIESLSEMQNKDGATPSIPFTLSKLLYGEKASTDVSNDERKEKKLQIASSTEDQNTPVQKTKVSKEEVPLVVSTSNDEGVHEDEEAAFYDNYLEFEQTFGPVEIEVPAPLDSDKESTTCSPSEPEKVDLKIDDDFSNFEDTEDQETEELGTTDEDTASKSVTLSEVEEKTSSPEKEKKKENDDGKKKNDAKGYEDGKGVNETKSTQTETEEKTPAVMEKPIMKPGFKNSASDVESSLPKNDLRDETKEKAKESKKQKQSALPHREQVPSDYIKVNMGKKKSNQQKQKTEELKQRTPKTKATKNTKSQAKTKVTVQATVPNVPAVQAVPEGPCERITKTVFGFFHSAASYLPTFGRTPANNNQMPQAAQTSNVPHKKVKQS